MSQDAIDVRGLSRKFGTFLAVDNLSFSVKQGEIFGFLGANGAGKSTTIRMMCGLLKPTAGTAIVGGVDVATDPEAVKRRIGYMSQRFSLYEQLTVDQNIRFFGGIYGLEGARLDARRRFALEMSGLQNRQHTRAADLAGRMKMPFQQGTVSGADSDSSSFLDGKIPAITIHGLSSNWRKVLHTNGDSVTKVNALSVFMGYTLTLALLGEVEDSACDAFR